MGDRGGWFAGWRESGETGGDGRSVINIEWRKLMFQTLTDLATKARAFILALAVVVWLAATLAVAVTRRSVLAAAGTFITGAFLVWAMYNSDLFRDKAGQDFGLGVVRIAVGRLM